MYDSPCSKIAKSSGAVIVKVSCPLAPEKKHHEIFAEAMHAVSYIYANSEKFGINKQKFAVAGNSSGGNIAALITNKIRLLPAVNISAQFLINPRTDISLTSGGTTEFESFEAKDIMLSKADSAYYRRYYLPEDANPRSPDISPYYDDLSNLPATTIFSGEYDGLRGDTEIYANKLIEHGVKTTKLIGVGQTHSTIIARKVLSDGIDPAITIGNAIKKELLA